MNKKFLSAILFGALMVTSTGTFVSCKDYDDDITELRGLIDQQKTDLSSKVTAVETSISSLQTAQTSLQTEIANAKTEAQKAALTAQEAAIATAKAELEDVKSELQAAIAANTEDVEALKTKVAAIEETMTLSLGRIQALEAFKTTTEAALEALAQADQTLIGSISALDATVIEQGQKIAALEAQIIALETYKGENQTAVDALKDKLADIEAGVLTEDMIKQIAEQVTEIAGAQLSVIEAAISKAVTHVEIVNYGFENTNSQIIKGNYTVMDLRTATAIESRIFGKDEKEAGLYTIANQKEFKEGEFAFLTDSVLIRVSPSNAVLTPEQVSFVNTELGNLSDLVVIDEVKPFKGMATRGISANGLWKVTFKLNQEKFATKEALDEAYMKAALHGYSKELTKAEIDKLNDIVYAVAVKDDPTKDTDRHVTSGYNLTLASKYEAQYELNFKVNDTSVAEIYNRFFKAEEKSVTGEPVYILDENGKPLYDYKWNIITVNGVKERVEKDGSLSIIDGTKYFSNAELPNGNKVDTYNKGDNRNTAGEKNFLSNDKKPFFAAKVNEPFTVELDYGSNDASESVSRKYAGIYGFYVVLDAYRAVESTPSEIVAWNAYEKNIEGLNTITTDRKLTLNIKDASAEGDIIGFRVYAVNQNGTLVDPDGKAFYVTVGEIKEATAEAVWVPTWSAVTIDGVAQAGINKVSGEFKELSADVLALMNNSNEYDYNLTALTYDENNPVVEFEGVEYKGEFSLQLTRDENTKITGIKATAIDDTWKYKDNGIYSMSFNITNKKGQIVKKVILNVEKEMPKFPEIFSAKAGQLNKDGVHLAKNNSGTEFYTRSSWNTPYDLTQVFNGLYDVDGEWVANWLDSEDNYTFKCEAIEEAANEDSYSAFSGQGDYNLYMPSEEENAFKVIGETYEVAVSFTYPEISSDNVADNHNYIVDGESFKIKLNCAESLKAKWLDLKADGVTPNDFELTYNVVNSDLVLGTQFEVVQNNAAKTKNFATGYNLPNGVENVCYIKNPKLVSNGLSEYFTVSYDNTTQAFTFTPVVGAVPPGEKVASKLTFTLVDYFGHEHEVTTFNNFVVKP